MDPQHESDSRRVSSRAPDLISRDSQAKHRRSSEEDQVHDKLNAEWAQFQMAMLEASKPTFSAPDGTPLPPISREWVAAFEAAFKRVAGPEHRIERDMGLAAAQRDAANEAQMKTLAEQNAAIDRDRPHGVAAMTPVVGEAGDAAAHFRHDQPGWGMVHLALAVTDVTLVKSLGVGGIKLGAIMLRKGLTTEALRIAPSVGKGWIEALPLDRFGRSRGAMAWLTPDMLKSGSRAYVKPVGWVEGDNSAHLIGALFGGTGDRRNLTPLLEFVNKSDHKTIENAIADELRAGHTVEYSVKPVYVGRDLRPVGLTLRVRSRGG